MSTAVCCDVYQSSSSSSSAGLSAQNSGQSEIENILKQLKEGKNVSEGLKVQ